MRELFDESDFIILTDGLRGDVSVNVASILNNNVEVIDISTTKEMILFDVKTLLENEFLFQPMMPHVKAEIKYTLASMFNTLICQGYIRRV